MTSKDYLLFQSQLSAHAHRILDSLKMLRSVAIEAEEFVFDDMATVRIGHAVELADDTIANATTGFYKNGEAVKLKKLEAHAPTMLRLIEQCEDYLSFDDHFHDWKRLRSLRKDLKQFLTILKEEDIRDESN